MWGFEAGPIRCGYASPRTQMLRCLPRREPQTPHRCAHVPRQGEMTCLRAEFGHIPH